LFLPKLSYQQKAVAVLTAYDDLIENNTRRIAILEEMAQRLYKEWFVNFRFPEHENAKFVDSPLGKIPEGWKVATLEEACALTMGQSPSSEFYNEKGEGLPFHQGVTNFGDRYPTHVSYTTVTNRVAKSCDVLFSVRAPVGRLNIADTQMVIGRGVSAIRHKQGKQVFLFHQLREKFKEEDTMGGGTIFKSVTKDDMQKIELISPTNQLVNAFEETVGGHFFHYHNLTKRNQLLRTTRDLLLPKLISGQLDVEDIDIDTLEPLVDDQT
jgi:type I restriction enzyme S subunit